ncbi:MAG: arsenite methyltransferase [Acidobacteria bacterium]|nr:arsenite methyltransferase [Acidobacteriota bacterium]NIM61563.1 arsenite methyltransferase [Acidobacteriota bacterium]NIQ84660.1 arsenite methyltransferase [Acidobacteriota bacterium]NIT10560.1 arsenite methyltransferase [Acidobacteriota bacterium]
MSDSVKDNETMVDKVRERYAEFAKQGGSCCGALESTGLGYDGKELSEIPDGADLGLGCGAPLPQLRLQPGETVLDLGSGGGIDVFLSARAVGPRGRAIGVDMTPEMLERARAAADEAGLDNVEFREGRLEALPVEDATVDAVTSNCVINLVPDKEQVFREIARVLKPEGRLVISDLVLDGALPESVANDVYAYVGCVSGAALRDTYFGWLSDAGLGDIEVLRDVDFLAGLREANPDEADELLKRTGVEWADLAGRVRSLTYRARKPSS